MKKTIKFLIIMLSTISILLISFSDAQALNYERLLVEETEIDFEAEEIHQAEIEFLEAAIEIDPNFTIEMLYDEFLVYIDENGDEDLFPDYFISLTPFGEPLSEEAIELLSLMRCATCTHFVHTRTAGPTIVQRSEDFGWHPSFSRGRVSGYWLSTSRHTTWSASARVGPVSVTMGVNGGGSGTFVRVVPVNGNDPWTRPRVIGDVSQSTFRVQERRNMDNSVIRTFNETTRIGVNQFLRIMVVDANGAVVSCNFNCN